MSTCARRRLLEAGHHPQRRGLAAARRPKQRDESSLLDAEVDVVDGEDVAIVLGHPLEGDDLGLACRSSHLIERFLHVLVPSRRYWFPTTTCPCGQRPERSGVCPRSQALASEPMDKGGTSPIYISQGISDEHRAVWLALLGAERLRDCDRRICGLKRSIANVSTAGVKSVPGPSLPFVATHLVVSSWGKTGHAADASCTGTLIIQTRSRCLLPAKALQVLRHLT